MFWLYISFMLSYCLICFIIIFMEHLCLKSTLFVCGEPLWPRLWSLVLSVIICICFLGFTFLAPWTVRIHNFMRCFQLYSFSWVVRPHKQNEFGPQNCMSTSLWLRILELKAKIDKLLSLQMINFLFYLFFRVPSFTEIVTLESQVYVWSLIWSFTLCGL